MTASSFPVFMAFIWSPTNDGARRDNAPGETFNTVRGITQMTWDAAARDGIVAGDLQDATDAQLTAIYQANYWNALRCNELPAGVDVMVANDAVLAGPGHAARLLQRCVGVAEDGAIGPETLRGVWRVGTAPLIDKLHDADDAFFASLAKAPLFLGGWTRREDDARALALRLIGAPAPAAVAQESADSLNAAELAKDT